MKKLFVYTLTFLLLSSFYSCKSSDSPEDYVDEAELRIFVTMNEQPYSNVLIDLQAVEMVNFQWEEGEYVHREWRRGTYEETQITNAEGFARFILRNLTIPDENYVEVKMIKIRTSTTVLTTDTTIYQIPQGGIKTLNYDF